MVLRESFQEHHKDSQVHTDIFLFNLIHSLTSLSLTLILFSTFAHSLSNTFTLSFLHFLTSSVLSPLSLSIACCLILSLDHFSLVPSITHSILHSLTHSFTASLSHSFPNSHSQSHFLSLIPPLSEAFIHLQTSLPSSTLLHYLHHSQLLNLFCQPLLTFFHLFTCSLTISHFILITSLSHMHTPFVTHPNLSLSLSLYSSHSFCNSPCRSVIVSVLRQRSLFSVSRAFCRLSFSCSSPSLLLSSWASRSCSSLRESSSCWACFTASPWAFFRRPDSCTSTCSLAFTSSSWERKRKWISEGKEIEKV